MHFDWAFLYWYICYLQTKKYKYVLVIIPVAEIKNVAKTILMKDSLELTV